jgi:hypothetical protein
MEQERVSKLYVVVFYLDHFFSRYDTLLKQFFFKQKQNVEQLSPMVDCSRCSGNQPVKLTITNCGKA